MSGLSHAASREDLERLWPVVASAHLFETSEEFVRAWQESPWAVRVTASAEAAVLGPWRAHLGFVAVRGIWCRTHRVPLMIDDLRSVAREHGASHLLGPLVPDDAVAPYLAAGLIERQRIVVYRMRPAAPASHSTPAGVSVRAGAREDLEAVAAIDRACFDGFWRYDAGTLAGYTTSERFAVAESGGRVVGYTLSTVHGVEATVGRLAVEPGERHRGIGTALLEDAVACAARMGAVAISLCTQEENAESRRLYRRAGFREAPGRLVSTISEPLQAKESLGEPVERS